MQFIPMGSNKMHYLAIVDSKYLEHLILCNILIFQNVDILVQDKNKC